MLDNLVMEQRRLEAILRRPPEGYATPSQGDLSEWNAYVESKDRERELGEFKEKGTVQR